MPQASYLPPPENVVWEITFTPGPAVGPAAAAVRAVAGPTAAVAPSRSYRILRSTEVDEYDSPAPPAEMATFGAVLATAANEKFSGTSRKASKITLSDAPVEVFADVRDLVDTLPAHNAMKNRQPPIKTTATSGRVAEEQRNVRVTAFLYAASRENDKDYHLIIGRDPAAAATYMTMEISGLPPNNSPHFPRLKAARDAFKDFLPQLPGTSYDFYDPPIPVEVEGSLFFDMSHATGSRPGPQSLRPDMPVVWEIHPISSIVFEP